MFDTRQRRDSGSADPEPGGLEGALTRWLEDWTGVPAEVDVRPAARDVQISGEVRAGPRRDGAQPCPPWCVASHAEEDEPHGRRHRTRARVIPVVLPAAGGPGHEVAESGEMVLEAHRRIGGQETWVYLGDGAGQRLEVSAESAARVAAGLAQMVRGLRS